MKIEVWTQPLFGSARKIRDDLLMFTASGKVYATWEALPTNHSGRRIPVNDPLASEVLGAERKQCPYTGTEPVYGMFKEGFHCWSNSSGDDALTVLRCTECGYSSTTDGNPRFRNAAFGTPSRSVHPPRTFLAAPTAKTAIFDKAGWDPEWNRLSPEYYEGGRLTVMVYNFWRRRVEPTSLPFAEVVYKRLPYGILTQSARAIS